MRSFDPPRRRRAPVTLRGRSVEGVARELHLDRLTLLLILKADCQACEEILTRGPAVFDGFDVFYLISDEALVASDAPELLLVPASTLEALEVRWPPAYVVVDPVEAEVIFEGVIFDAAQVAEEIGHLAAN